MRTGAALLAVLAAGCIEAQLQPCGDLLCAPDAVCLENETCASRESVDACSGLAEDAGCSTTLFDGSCAGGVCTAARCGDGNVSGDERCDGPVTDTDCVEFGFDYGVPACNDRCDIDLINSCTRFGWRRLLSIPIEAMWSDGVGGLAFQPVETGDAVVRWGGEEFVEPGEWDELVGNATTVFAVQRDRAIVSTGGAWQDVPAPGVFSTVRHATVTQDGTLYIAYALTCTISRLPPGGTWQQIEPGAGNCYTMAASGNAILVGYEDGNIRRYDGGWSTVEFIGEAVSALTEIDGFVLYGTTFSPGLSIIEGGQTFQIHADPCVQLVRAGDYIFSHNGEGDYRRLDGTELIERLSAPTYGEMYADAAGNFYVYGNGINILTDFAYSEHEGVDGLTLDMTMTGEGLAVVSNMDGVYAINTNDYWNQVPIGGGMVAVAGPYTDELYISDGSQIQFFDGVTSTDITPPAFAGAVKDLWVPGETNDIDLFAVGSSALIMSYTYGEAWVTHAPPANSAGCNLYELAGAADESALYAVGDCAGVGVVWKKGAGTTWSEVYRGGPALRAVTVASDGEVFAAGPLGGSRTVNGVWDGDAGAAGISISATTSNDVWCGGGPGEVVRWNGTEWSRVAVRGAISPRVIATPTAVYFGGTSQSVLLR